MLFFPKCLTCVFDDLVGALQLLDLPSETKDEIVKQSLKYCANNYSRDKLPSHYITKVHRILKQVSGIETPFSELRRACNDVGIILAEKLHKEIQVLSDRFERFRLLVRWAIAGNVLDFRTVGTGYGFGIEQIEAMVKKPFDQGLAVDDTEEIFELLGKLDNVLYVHDNVGEIALDKMLIKELTENMGKTVISAVRRGPITSDATFQDAEYVGLSHAGCSVIIGCEDTLGLQWEELTDQFHRALKEAGMVITKGQANYYIMSEIGKDLGIPIACLFTSKCDPVSAEYGLTGKVNIASLLTKHKK